MVTANQLHVSASNRPSSGCTFCTSPEEPDVQRQGPQISISSITPLRNLSFHRTHITDVSIMRDDIEVPFKNSRWKSEGVYFSVL